MSNHEQYVDLVKSRFSTTKDESYAAGADYFALIYGPYQYEVEDEVFEYLKTHPDATIRETFLYFYEISPEGLAPGDDGADLFDDDDEE